MDDGGMAIGWIIDCPRIGTGARTITVTHTHAHLIINKNATNLNTVHRHLFKYS